MPRGDKSSGSAKPKRRAEHIEVSVAKRGGSEKDAARIAWAMVNKQDHGGENRGAARRRSSAARDASA
jgi:hypothetical protein